MLGKYINQFMADNELSVNEEFFISSRAGYPDLLGRGGMPAPSAVPDLQAATSISGGS